MTASVLVVDDDPAFRALTERMLGTLGLRVVGTAATVAEAIAAVDRLRPRAVLLDVGLPDGDGVELASRLSTLPWRPRIVLTSSDPDAATPELARDAGAEAFIPKDQLIDGALGQLLGG